MTGIINEKGVCVADVVPFQHHLLQAEDCLEALGRGIYRLTRVFRTKKQGIVPAVGLKLDLECSYVPEFMMIPAVMYNGNPWGDGKEPTGWTYEGTPWSFAYHRTAIAGGTYSGRGGLSVALFADRATTGCGFSCSLFLRGDRAVHRLIVPEEEMPRSYLVKGRLDEGYRDTILIKPGEPLILTAMVVAGEGSYRDFLDTAWRLNHHEVKPWHGHEHAWELALTYAKEGLWVQDGAFSGFSIGMLHDDGTGGWKRYAGYESGWCGQNISLGCSMLYDYLLHGNADSLKKGLESLDAWAGAFLPSGLFCPHYDALLGLRSMEDLKIDSCNLGGSAENFIEGWKLARECGCERPRYLDAARKILDCSMRNQQSDGSYPSAYRPDGSVTDAGGSTGGFIIPAMMWMHAVSGSEEILASAAKAMDHYFGQFHTDGFTTAGALDSMCIDKESAYPLLSSAIMLHKSSGDLKYLDMAVEVACYLSTWQWHHSVPYPEGSALCGMGYDTFGGTAVSTQHHHIDPYALRYAPYLMELATLTGQPIWRERAMAAWNNASIGVSDGTLEVMGKIRPTGSQDEAFMHTRWGDPFNVSQWLVAWPAAFRLEVLRKTRFFTRTDMGDGMRV